MFSMATHNPEIPNSVFIFIISVDVQLKYEFIIM